jgi:hypothetical protein
LEKINQTLIREISPPKVEDIRGIKIRWEVVR